MECGCCKEINAMTCCQLDIPTKTGDYLIQNKIYCYKEIFYGRNTTKLVVFRTRKT